MRQSVGQVNTRAVKSSGQSFFVYIASTPSPSLSRSALTQCGLGSLTFCSSLGKELMRIGPKSNIQARLFQSILRIEMIVDDFVAVLTRVLRLRTIVVLVGLCAWLPLAGCQILGPAALGTGRGAYNDVIARTSSEQTLGLMVRLRYSDPINLLAVSSVTAGLKFSTQAKGEAGFGSPASYAGALVPFSAGVTYEDSPLISYTPVDAQAFLREWLAPVTLEMLALAMQGGPPGQDALTVLLILVERMNGLRSGVGATVEERTAFRRVATLLTQFRELGVALWVQESGATGRYELILSHYSPGRIAEVEEFLRLLDLQGNPAQESTIRIPVALGVRDGNFTGLAVQTRSVAEIMHSVAASIEVPGEHVKEGLVETRSVPPEASGTLGPIMRIHSSRSTPRQANVAVQHRGWWYYVDDTDLASKRAFLQIQMLFFTRLSEATRGAQGTPLLTIPVK